jgi:hypothetical protein
LRIDRSLASPGREYGGARRSTARRRWRQTVPRCWLRASAHRLLDEPAAAWPTSSDATLAPQDQALPSAASRRRRRRSGARADWQAIIALAPMAPSEAARTARPGSAIRSEVGDEPGSRLW